MSRIISKEIFKYGIRNTIGSELIPRGAASDSLGWVTKGDSIESSRGRAVHGDEDTAIGKVRGLFFGFTATGTPVLFKKASTKVQYLDTTTNTWTDSITGLDADDEYTFAEYHSLAGAFVYIGGKGGLFKICTANPADSTSLYVDGTNFKGKITIGDARMFLWDRVKDGTGLNYSYVDSVIYTTVSGESIGALGSTTYTGTLAFRASNLLSTCFAVSFLEASGETFTDNYDGTLTGDAGGTGTINYTTGAYSVTFNAVTTGAVTVDYQHENSNNNGITDFTSSTPRLAGEGGSFRQDQGGDRILNVEKYDGKFYSMKKRSVYELSMTIDDTNATNLIYRNGIGMENFRASVATGEGIVFIDSANPNKPRLVRLQKNITGDSIEPEDLMPNFDLSGFLFNDCAIDTWGENVVFTGRTLASTTNNKLFRYNTRVRSMDILPFAARVFATDAGVLYTGDTLSNNIYKTFTGFDDEGFEIENFWDGNDDKFDAERLKRVRRLEFRGQIEKTQNVEVYGMFDNDIFELLGTIRGDSNYVDLTQPYVIGTTEIGSSEIGGGTPTVDEPVTIYNYAVRFKINTPKFYRMKLRYKYTGIGFASISQQKDVDIRLFRERIPVKYRIGDVNLDGTEV
tara:strand:+ start:12556 stop:14436 length:1881 start_codon:yes stop_codon:yes gene_type:complete